MKSHNVGGWILSQLTVLTGGRGCDRSMRFFYKRVGSPVSRVSRRFTRR